MSGCPLPNRAKTARAIWHYLRDHGRATAPELAAAIGSTHHSVNVILQWWRGKLPGKCFRIAAWERQTIENGRHGGGSLAIYVAEAGRDAPRPAPFTNVERHARHYPRHQAAARVRALVRRRTAKGAAPTKSDAFQLMLSQLGVRKSPRNSYTHEPDHA